MACWTPDRVCRELERRRARAQQADQQQPITSSRITRSDHQGADHEEGSISRGIFNMMHNADRLKIKGSGEPSCVEGEKGEPPCRLAPDFDLEEPEGQAKRGSVSSNKAGIRHRRDRPPTSKKESDQKL